MNMTLKHTTDYYRPNLQCNYAKLYIFGISSTRSTKLDYIILKSMNIQFFNNLGPISHDMSKQQSQIIYHSIRLAQVFNLTPWLKPFLHLITASKTHEKEWEPNKQIFLIIQQSYRLKIKKPYFLYVHAF